jgi:hypothetical protein
MARRIVPAPAPGGARAGAGRKSASTVDLEKERLSLVIPPGTKVVQRFYIRTKNKKTGASSVQVRTIQRKHEFTGMTLGEAAWARLAASLDCDDPAIALDAAKYVIDREHGAKIKKAEIKLDLSSLKHYGNPEDMEAI